MTRGLVGCRRRCSNLSVGASLLLQLRHAAHERLDLLEEEGLRLLLVGRRLVELLQQPHVRLEGRDSGRIQHAVKEEAKEVERLELALLGDLHQSLHADGDARLCVLLRLRLLQRRADLVADLPLLDLKLVEPLLLHCLLVADALLGRLHLRVRRLLHPESRGDGVRRSVDGPLLVLVLLLLPLLREAADGALLQLIGGDVCVVRLLLLLLLGSAAPLLPRRLLLAPVLLALALARVPAALDDAALSVGRVVEHVVCELVRHVRDVVVAARLAVEHDPLLRVELHRRLRQLALGAQHPLLDELVGLVLQVLGLVPAGDAALPLRLVEGRDRAELNRAVLGEVFARPLERLADVRRVDDHRLLAVAAPLLLADHRRHLVPVRWIIATADVEHGCHPASLWSTGVSAAARMH
mmetsp:Transcript_3908/g.11682  ORF Transcript_3908/g.11682 Transcript_3908/m.11682 type:complete len:410 (-) Transcript_3908:27-1256(-)